MTDFQIGLLAFPVLLAFIFVRVPIAVAMLSVGVGGKFLIEGNLRGVNSLLKTDMFDNFYNSDWAVVPLFLLMSEFATKGGLSRALFEAANAFLGHRRGGTAMAAIGASAGFGAICGSSLATATTMGRVALPELQRVGYSGGLSTGALAAGGTLGILIPPSIVLIIYGNLAEANVERLFLAAFIPGLIAMAGYMVTVALYVRLIPQSEQRSPRQTYAERLPYLRQALPVVLIFVLMMGGIYTGLFSVASAAGIGAGLTFVFAWRAVRRSGETSWGWLSESIVSAAKTGAMILFIVVAAKMFNAFLSSAQVPQTIAGFFAETGLSALMVVVGMLLLYILLGTVMDSIAMIFLTVPIFVPIVLQLDLGLPPDQVLLWFGILVLMSAEIGLITPPVGLNLFVINAMTDKVSIGETYRGVLPFVASDLVRIAILVAFPAISLWLVRLIY